MRLARSHSLHFLNISLLCSTVSAARRALSLSFLSQRQSSCSYTDLRALLGLLWASMFTHRSACACFGLKESQSLAFTERHIYTHIYIYEKSTIQLTSVGLAQARPNYICTLHCTLPVVFCTAFTAVLYVDSYLCCCI